MREPIPTTCASVSTDFDLTVVHVWLQQHKRDLRPDPSHYAEGRLKFWFRKEPHLGRPGEVLPGVDCDDDSWARLQRLMGWDFDWCLITYSGDQTPVGITQHRDAAFTDREARGLNVSGTCAFEIWEGKASDPPTRFLLRPGDLITFDCKRLHAATPSVGRWCVNTWKSKPPVVSRGVQLGLI